MVNPHVKLVPSMVVNSFPFSQRFDSVWWFHWLDITLSSKDCCSAGRRPSRANVLKKRKNSVPTFTSYHYCSFAQFKNLMLYSVFLTFGVVTACPMWNTRTFPPVLAMHIQRPCGEKWIPSMADSLLDANSSEGFEADIVQSGAFCWLKITLSMAILHFGHNALSFVICGTTCTLGGDRWKKALSAAMCGAGLCSAEAVCLNVK